MIARRPGFYWLRRVSDGEMRVAEWVGDAWLFTGCEHEMCEEHIEACYEITAGPIEKPKPKPALSISQIIERGRALLAGMTPAEREAVWDEHRKCWVMGEIAIGLDEDEAQARREFAVSRNKEIENG